MVYRVRGTILFAAETTMQPNDVNPISDTIETDAKEPFHEPVSASSTSEEAEANKHQPLNRQCSLGGKHEASGDAGDAGHASEKPGAISQGQQEPAIDGPPDSGLTAWMTVVGGFCSMFVSFGWTNCECPRIPGSSICYGSTSCITSYPIPRASKCCY